MTQGNEQAGFEFRKVGSRASGVATLAGDELTGYATETRDGREIKYEVLAVRRIE